MYSLDMDWPKLLVLVRHAESEGNIFSSEERVLLGCSHYSLALTERGHKQAIITGDYVSKLFGDFDAYFHSYYERSRQTFQFMFPGKRGIEDARLAERQGGIWQVMTEGQIMNRFPEEFERKKREGHYHYRPFGGENWPDVELRIHSFLDMLRRDYNNKRIFCVVHSHWLILFRRILHNISIEEALEDFQKDTTKNASVTVYKKTKQNGHYQLALCEYNLIPWEGQIDELRNYTINRK